MFAKFLAAALVFAWSIGLAMAQTESGTTDAMPGQMMMKMESGKTASEADKGYMEAMNKMHESMMNMEMTGDASRDFALMMIPHHQSAIDMAQALLKEPNADPQIKSMAEKIITDQQKEIDEFKTWLEAHKQ
jgi:uncharacterized protein (DUF305 family)